MSEKEYTVYMHTNKVNGKKYIGMTSQNPITRWANGHGYRRQSRFKAAIMEYGWRNFTHEILYTGLTKEEAEKIEVELIEEYQTTDSRYGYNTDSGGISSITFGKDHKKHLSEACKGRIITEETRRKISEKNTGENNPMYGKKRDIAIFKTKSVICIETNEVYPSVSEASRQTGINAGSISMTCNGKLNTAGKFHWKFKIGGD